MKILPLCHTTIQSFTVVARDWGYWSSRTTTFAVFLELMTDGDFSSLVERAEALSLIFLVSVVGFTRHLQPHNSIKYMVKVE